MLSTNGVCGYDGGSIFSLHQQKLKLFDLHFVWPDHRRGFDVETGHSKLFVEARTHLLL